ncbi:MAG TPA: DEAD/DEAH box helicase [Fimbriimonadaceae bacterium]|nr:DEAD/DEAH box helicase [Fimbriimonadaceae bacterium]
MRVETLEAYNVSTDLLEIWRTTVGPTLLPVQALAVKEYGLFTGGNLIVFSPTSSGKTFIGEMAAVKAARENMKVFYLVPQKALAEEKYREFSRRYSKAGIDVAISSRDRREFDRQILGRQFQIAIVVYEKLQTLLVAQPNLIQGIGLVVVDELQMLTDDERGPGLELLLTKLKMAGSHPRLIGLSAVLGKAALLAEWLEAKLLIDTRRPVELRKGVLCQGVFRYREHNSEREGTEEILVPPTKDRSELLVAAADTLTRRGEQVLVFVPDRATATTMAQRMAGRARLPAAETARARLREGDETLARGELLASLESGVAFHHADLTLEEREIVEEGFRSGEVRAIVATTTLAIGMNLPAKNVLLDGRRWKMLRQYGRWSLEDLEKSEYENMSGRAGRLSLTKDFGRSILVTASPFEADAWLRCYIGREFEAIAPTLKDAPLEDHVLDVVASGLGRSRKQIAELLLASFTGKVHWKDAMGRERFLEAIDEALTLCRNGGLVRDVEDGRLALTHLGRACAAKGLGVRTSAKMAVWAAESRDAAVADLEIVSLLGTTVAGAGVYVALTRQEERRTSYRAEILARARALGVEGRPVFRGFAEDRWAAEYEESKGHKKTAILLDWIAEAPTKEIEQRYEVWAGAIARIGEEYGWLAEALADICRASNWPADESERIRTLAGRLAYGVEADALPLMRVRVPRLGRVTAGRLRSAGLIDIDRARAATPDTLRKVVGRKATFDVLWARLHDDGRVTGSGSSVTEPAEPELTAPGAAGTVSPAASSEPPGAVGQSPELLVDVVAGRVVFHGIEIPTSPPNHIQRQPLLYLAALARQARTAMTDVDLAAAVAEIGGRRRRPVAPDLKDLRYKIVRPFRLRLRDTPMAEAANDLVESTPAGLRLNVAGSVEVRARSKTA